MLKSYLLIPKPSSKRITVTNTGGGYSPPNIRTISTSLHLEPLNHLLGASDWPLHSKHNHICARHPNTYFHIKFPFRYNHNHKIIVLQSFFAQVCSAPGGQAQAPRTSAYFRNPPVFSGQAWNCTCLSGLSDLSFCA